MKKILALVLATAMLSTTAFAAKMDDASGATRVNPDSTMEVYAENFTPVVVGDVTPALFTQGELTSANFSVTKKISKGANLVKSVTINDDKGRVDIKFVADYGLTYKIPDSGLVPNVVFEKLELKAKKDIERWTNGTFTKTIKRGNTYTLTNKAGFRVGYLEVPADVDGQYALDGLVKFTGASYGIASQGIDELEITGRVYKDSKIFTKFDVEVGDDQKAALKAYPDADLRFINFTTNGLDSNNDVVLAIGEDEFVYEIADGKVVASKLKWNSEESAYTGKIRSSVKYVISDIKLTAAAADAVTPENPSTGANDVVGVAAALAVVSLVAAGAVSLKK